MNITKKMNNAKTAAIICEYNPYHGGHKYQTEKLRQEGYENIIAVMSGSVVQRGEIACADKFTRARAAVDCGADVVVELPCPYSCSSAEYFAYGGVFVANALRADVLSFGSECGDIDILKRHAEQRKVAAPGEGAAMAELCGTEFSSNDILGIEYLRAIKKLNSHLVPLTHQRIGGAYRSDDINVEHPSASAIRRLLSNGDHDAIERIMPPPAYEAFKDSFECANMKRRDLILFSMLTAKFMFTDEGELSKAAFLSGGLAGRMKKAAETAVDLDDFYAKCATKVYTDGRIRRAAICGLCKIDAASLKTPPEYLTLLAASKRGRKYLSENKFDIEICSNIRQKKKYPSFEYEKRFDLLYSAVTLDENEHKREIFCNRSPYISQS